MSYVLCFLPLDSFEDLPNVVHDHDQLSSFLLTFFFSPHFGFFCSLPSSRCALLSSCQTSEVTLHSYQAGNWFFICLLYSSTTTPWNDIACFISSLIRPTVIYCARHRIIYLAPPQCQQPQSPSKPKKKTKKLNWTPF